MGRFFGWILGGIAVVLILVLILFNGSRGATITQPTVPSPTPIIIAGGVDPANSTYIIEGRSVTLTDGVYEESIPNSSTKIVTRLFSEPATGDMNGDETDDAGVILTQEPGGSGTFFYSAVAIQEEGMFFGTNGVLLGDIIAPQTYAIAKEQFVVNYADRPEGAPMTESPSVGVTDAFEMDGDKLVEAEFKGVN